jgi:hypothetical protein
MIVCIDTEILNRNVEGRPKATYGMEKDQAGSVMGIEDKMRAMGRAPADAGKTGGTYVKIPPKYAEKDKSPLRVKLSRGSNSKDFDLTDD